MKKRKWVRRLLKTICIIILIILAIFIFIKLWPSFGKKPSAEDRKEYSKRAENFDGNIFSNEHEFHVMISPEDGVVDGVISNKKTTPEEEIPTKTPDINLKADIDEVTVTWFGHSTLLLQMHGMNILIDPIFSEYSSPVSFIGNKRFSEPPIDIADLPEIDIVIISHDHFDHLDYSSIKELDGKVKQYIVPLGVENDLEHWNVSESKISNMAWWEEIEVNGLTIGCTPARHYSGRSIDDRYATLWASWVFKDENHLIYECGDSGYDTHYQEIHDKYGDFDFALMDCAQYSIRWPDVHQTPEEAFLGIQELGAKTAMPIHWGAFRLSSHPWDDSATRLVKAAENSDVVIATPMLGETMNLDDVHECQIRWYEDIR